MTPDSKSADEGAIREVIEAFTKALRAKNVEGMLRHCAPDIATFDMVPPLQHKGLDALRLWTETLAGFEAPLEYEVRHLEIMVGGDVVWSRSFNRFGGTRKEKDGERAVNWLSSTFGFRKTDGRWTIAHQHASVPFDMKTGRAMLDLKPETP